MAFKDLFKRREEPKIAQPVQDDVINALITSDRFPVIRPSQTDLSRYRQIPLGGIAALGAAFSQLPQAARTIVKTVQTQTPLDGQLFVGIPPNGVSGFLRVYENGTSGNIMRYNQQGKAVITGRMRFRPVDVLPAEEITSTVVPFDPVTLAISAAIMRVEQKLAVIEKKTDEILQFLKLDKQSRQRGNLNTLAEIMQEYCLNCSNRQFCISRSSTVLAVRQQAQQDMLFYQEQLSNKLRQQKALHASKDARLLTDAVIAELSEYQLACCLYGYASFLDVLLQKDFQPHVLQAVVSKMKDHAQTYADLYTQCHAQIANYQRSAIDAQLLGGLGSAAKAAGRKIADMPLLGKTSVDEALQSAGDSLRRHNKSVLVQRLEQMAHLQDDRIQPFTDSLCTLNVLVNHPQSMMTDGEMLYVLDTPE